MTMTPAASKFVMGARAAARGTLNRKAMMHWRTGGTKRFLTLPPGSVRGYPSMEEFYQERSSCDDADQENLPQVKMSPQRNYGTVSFDAPQNVDPVAATYREDYDHWSVHSKAASSTTSSLGLIYDESSSDVFSTTLTGDVLRFSDLSTFSASEEDYFTALERRLGISNLGNGSMIDDGKYY